VRRLVRPLVFGATLWGNGPETERGALGYLLMDLGSAYIFHRPSGTLPYSTSQLYARAADFVSSISDGSFLNLWDDFANAPDPDDPDDPAHITPHTAHEGLTCHPREGAPASAPGPSTSSGGAGTHSTTHTTHTTHHTSTDPTATAPCLPAIPEEPDTDDEDPDPNSIMSTLGISFGPKSIRQAAYLAYKGEWSKAWSQFTPSTPADPRSSEVQQALINLCPHQHANPLGDADTADEPGTAPLEIQRKAFNTVMEGLTDLRAPGTMPEDNRILKAIYAHGGADGLFKGVHALC